MSSVDRTKIKQIALLMMQASEILMEMAEEQETDNITAAKNRKTPEGLYTTGEIAEEFGISAVAANKLLVLRKKASKEGHRIVPDHQLFYEQLCCKRNHAPYWTEKGREWLCAFLQKESRI